MLSHRLNPRAAGSDARLPALVGGLIGVQAQDLSAAALALRARTSGLSATEVQRAREVERSITLTWCMRGTLHLVATEDLAWLLPLFGPLFIRKSRRRYEELGLGEAVLAEATRVIRDELAARAPQTRAELAVPLAARGIPVAGQAIAHLIGHAALQGIICHGPRRGAAPTYVLLSDWAPPGKPLDPERAPAELARRYLAAYGPATTEDLAGWSGLPLGIVRAALSEIIADLEPVDMAGRAGWMLRRADLRRADVRRHDERSAEPVVRLLPSYDVYLLGYRHRGLIVAPGFETRVNAGGGLIAPTLVVNGQVVGVWRGLRRSGGLTVAVAPFAPLDPLVMRGLEAEAHDVGRFLGLEATLHVTPPE